MVQNRFEVLAKQKIAQDKTDQAERAQQQNSSPSIDAEQARNYSDQTRLRQEQLRRKKNFAGDQPLSLWGQEAAELCSDFIEFAVAASACSKGMLIKSETLYTPPFTLSRQQTKLNRERIRNLSGYAIGFTAITPPAPTRSASLSRETKIQTPDVFLCADGLVRAKNGPLELINPDGKVDLPLMGEWHVTYETKLETLYHYDHSRGGDPAGISRKANIRHLSANFRHEDPVTHLEKVLTQHAVDIYQETQR